MSQASSVGDGNGVVLVSGDKVLRRLLMGLNGGPKMLSEVSTITRNQWKLVRGAVRELNLMCGGEVVRLLERSGGGKTKTYYELSQSFVVECNLDQVIVRKKV